jgi:hypothetical protein
MGWIYKGKEITDVEVPADALGFIYRITRISDGKWYIGRKNLLKSKTIQSKGIKKKSKVASDWKTYWSSSKDIQELVTTEGEDNFTREILLFCTTKACILAGEEYFLYISGSIWDQNCFNNNIRSKVYRNWFGKTPNFFKELQSVKF